MKKIFVYYFSLLVLCSPVVRAVAANEEPGTKNQEQIAVPFRPENGKFPPLEKAASYRGELVFVDHATRRGSLRVEFKSEFFRSPPTPFALLPYGMVRYHGAPADLRDIPLGTVLNIRAFLPPDSKNSSVVTSPNHWYPLPLENHAFLIEDEPSLCLREGKTWKLKEVDMKSDQGLVIATCDSKDAAAAKSPEQKLTLDATTRFWRGRESLKLSDLIAEGTWPASGKKSLGGQSVLLGLNWKPCPDGIFVRYHISDVWLDDTATQRAIQDQTEVHKALIRSRWMPAFVDNVEYGKFGRATVTVTLFGGMDPSLYADFKKGGQAAINGAELTLKHTHGSYGPAHMASKGSILEVIKAPAAAPLGSSGIQVTMETDLIIEGIRPGRVVRIRAPAWPNVYIPREEYIEGGDDSFPSPNIFPIYR